MPLSRSTTKTVIALAFCGVAASTLAACHPARIGQGANRDDRAVTVSGRLECPTDQGDLKRTAIAADGRSCTYADSEGREARLMFLELAGKSAKDALLATETDLKALVPSAAPPADMAAPPTPPTPPEGGRDRTRIDLPGIHIEADDHDHAHIRAFGQTIDAEGKNAVVRGGWNGKEATVIAHDKGVEVRAGWFGAKSINANYLLASETAGPTGMHAAGYYARGPATGPIVVGVETSKAEDDHDRRHNDFKDLRRLVDLNVHRS